MSRRKGGRAPSTRFTVSLPDPLMRVLDRLRTDRRYGNRSEFVRDLLRQKKLQTEAARVRDAILVGYQDAIDGRVVPFEGNLRRLLKKAKK